jgi:hypothetical protein
MPDAPKQDLTVNSKGGSMTVTLKKPLRELLGQTNGHVTAFSLTFAPGKSAVVLMGPDVADATEVRQLGSGAFEISFETEAREVDTLTAAFIRLQIDQLEKEKLPLTEPQTADQWSAEMRSKIKPLREALERLSPKSPRV